MARSKTKKRRSNSPTKVSGGSGAAAVEFAEAEDVPEAETISDLKKASGSQGSGGRSAAKSAAAKKQAKKPAKSVTPQRWSVAERLRLKWGTGPVKILALLIRAVLLAAVVLVVWVFVLIVASSLVPTTAQLVSDGTGVTFQSRLDDIILALLLPTVFLNGLLFVLVCVLVKKLWQFHVRLGTRARDILLGDDS